MTIQLKCPNGHTLSAQESNVGKTGKCPVCKAPVIIPEQSPGGVSDSSIVVKILGDPSVPQKNRSNTPLPPKKKKTSVPQGDAETSPNVKICPNCEKDIDMGYHICPHCKTYITGLNDF